MAEIFKADINVVDGLTLEGLSRDFKITIDEPVELGGNDKGMNPVELLLQSIGGCKTIVCLAFAEHHGIKIDEIKLEMEGELDPAGFLGTDPNAKIGFSKIKTNYIIKSENSEEELEKFIEFVESNCPVMDTIVNNPEFKSELTKK